jgi:hypothetical protein
VKGGREGSSNNSSHSSHEADQMQGVHTAAVLTGLTAAATAGITCKPASAEYLQVPCCMALHGSKVQLPTGTMDIVHRTSHPTERPCAGPYPGHTSTPTCAWSSFFSCCSAWSSAARCWSVERREVSSDLSAPTSASALLALTPALASDEEVRTSSPRSRATSA